MAASINDMFTKVGGEGTITTLEAPGKAIAATSINIGSGTNWPTDTSVYFAIRTTEVVAGETQTKAGTYTVWKGIISGNIINNIQYVGGAADQVYAAGATTQVYIGIHAEQTNELVDGILVQHNQDGTHAAITATSLTVTGAVTLPAGALETQDYATASVSAPKIDFGGSGSGVWWEEIGRTTLGVAGDTITVNIAARKYLRVILYTAHSGSINPCIRFNGITTAAYAYRYSTNGGADTIASSVNEIAISTAAAVPRFSHIDIVNTATEEKLVFGQTVARNNTGAANIPDKWEVVGKWANSTDAITAVNVVNTSTGDFAIGSQVIVLGHD